MLRLSGEATQRLAELDERLRSLRAEKARARKVVDAAKQAAASAPDGSDGEPQIAALKSAVEALKTIEAQIEAVHEDQVGLLRTAGGPQMWTSADGWGDIARRLDIDGGITKVEVPLGSLVAPLGTAEQMGVGSVQAGSFTPPSSAGAQATATQRLAFQQPTLDRRFLYNVLPTAPLDDGALSVVDFVQTGSRAVTGNVVRDPLAT